MTQPRLTLVNPWPKWIMRSKPGCGKMAIDPQRGEDVERNLADRPSFAAPAKAVKPTAELIIVDFRRRGSPAGIY